MHLVMHLASGLLPTPVTAALAVSTQLARLNWIDLLRPRAILFITDPEETALVRCKGLCQDFGLTPAEAAEIAGLYDDDARFRATIDMARHRFGEGHARTRNHTGAATRAGCRRGGRH